jgi:TPR repeat protein
MDIMTKKADDKQSKLDSLRIELAEIGDEIWNDHQAANLDDSNPSSASSQRGAGAIQHVGHDEAVTSAQRPVRASKFRSREEIFEHRMAVMAHRRAQLDAHRNRQARKWFAFTTALMFIGASGLGAFYYRTAGDWKFLSSYSLDTPTLQLDTPTLQLDTPTLQSVQTASAAGDGGALDGSSSSHFQNAEALALSSSADLQQPAEEVVDIPVVEVPRLREVEIEKTAEPVREPVAPSQSQKQVVAELQPARPVPNFVKPVAKRLVRIAPTAMPAAPGTVYNLNRSQSAAASRAATSELIPVPVETAREEATQKIASLSPQVIAPKTATTSADTLETRPDAAIESALSVPAKSMQLGSSDLTEEKTAKGIPSPLRSQNGKAVSVLLKRGDKLLLLGDIVSARQLYQHAFRQGDQFAAARIGSTYDPRIFAQLGVQGLRPNSKLALDWYNKAVDAGDESAKQTARSLSRQINQP